MLDPRSEKNLLGVHPNLVRLVRALSEKKNFIVTEGLRDFSRQKKLYAEGRSKTLASKHLVQRDGYCHAVDLAMVEDGKISWSPAPYCELAYEAKKIAEELGVKIKWGGDFTNFFDGPHFELIAD